MYCCVIIIAHEWLARIRGFNVYCVRCSDFEDNTEWASETPKSLWKKIVTEAQEYFRFSLDWLVKNYPQIWWSRRAAVHVFQIFFDCNCLKPPTNASTLTLTISTNTSQSDGSIPFENYVTSGPCDSGNCINIYFFTVLIILTCLTIFITGTANQTATLRYIYI